MNLMVPMSVIRRQLRLQMEAQEAEERLINELNFSQDPRWIKFNQGIAKLIAILEELPENGFVQEDHFSHDELAGLKLLVKDIWSDRFVRFSFYDKYGRTFEDYVRSRVLPSLREKHDESLLRDLVKRRADHDVVVEWLVPYFQHLENFIRASNLRRLQVVSWTCFVNQVFEEIKLSVRDVVISLINREREGGQIDRALLKNVIDIFVEIGRDCYEYDFEFTMLKDTGAYYCWKASKWIEDDSCPDYMLKVDECLEREKDRVSHYLHSSSEQWLLKIVQRELLTPHIRQLLEKEHTGFCALLKNDKVEDLSRMFRLLSMIPHGLDPMRNMFKQHVTGDGIALVKQAGDGASNKKNPGRTANSRLSPLPPEPAGCDRGATIDIPLDSTKDIQKKQKELQAKEAELKKREQTEKRDVVGLQELVFAKSIIDLHDKYMAYVNDCFQNHTLFHKALKKAFKIFCNKTIGGSSSTELLGTFVDNILEKGGSAKFGDEVVEVTLEKVIKLLAYINEKDEDEDECSGRMFREYV